jgi:hypothetical protein
MPSILIGSYHLYTNLAEQLPSYQEALSSMELLYLYNIMTVGMISTERCDLISTSTEFETNWFSQHQQ